MQKDTWRNYVGNGKKTGSGCKFCEVFFSTVLRKATDLKIKR